MSATTFITPPYHERGRRSDSATRHDEISHTPPPEKPAPFALSHSHYADIIDSLNISRRDMPPSRRYTMRDEERAVLLERTLCMMLMLSVIICRRDASPLCLCRDAIFSLLRNTPFISPRLYATIQLFGFTYASISAAIAAFVLPRRFMPPVRHEYAVMPYDTLMLPLSLAMPLLLLQAIATMQRAIIMPAVSAHCWRRYARSPFTAVEVTPKYGERHNRSDTKMLMPTRCHALMFCHYYYARHTYERSDERHSILQHAAIRAL